MTRVGIAFLSLLAGVVGLDLWLLTGGFGPLRDLPEADWIFVLPPLWQLPLWWGPSAGVLLGVHGLLARRLWSETSPAHVLAWARVRLWWPLLLLTLPPVALALLATPLMTSAPPWLYLFVDLRWWLAGAAALFVFLNFDATSRAPIAPRIAAWVGTTNLRSRRAWWLQGGLAAVLAAASLATSPPWRFQNAVLGDEPKYLRYLENWYRGRGLDIDGLTPLGERPENERRNLAGNLEHLADAGAWLVSDLAGDARRLAGVDAPPRTVSANRLEGWFVEGKRGGVYQIHPPGLAFLLFPGYFFDRDVADWAPGPVWKQLPADLYGTSLVLLLIYALWGVAIARLLWSYTGNALTACLMSAVVTLALPSSAFAYQFYPEAAAGLFVALLVRYAIMSSDDRPARAFAYGLVAGFLPWLHVRFGVLTLIGGAAFSVTRRHSRRSLVWFWFGSALPLAALGAFNYHVTGSPMPWALYALTNEGALFHPRQTLADLPWMWFDWIDGLLAQAPIYLLALPGLWIAWQRSRAGFAVVASCVLAISVLAAAHGWGGGGTTPLRLIAAVVPLLALPICDAIGRYGRSRWFLVALAVLGVMSIEGGLAYHPTFDKGQASFPGLTLSGWRPSLLLPHQDPGNAALRALTWIWLVLTFMLAAAPAMLRRWGGRPAAPPRGALSWASMAGAVLIAVALSASIVGGAVGFTWRTRFMADPSEVRTRLLRVYQDGAGLVWSARRGAVPIDQSGLLP